MAELRRNVDEHTSTTRLSSLCPPEAQRHKALRIQFVQIFQSFLEIELHFRTIPQSVTGELALLQRFTETPLDIIYLLSQQILEELQIFTNSKSICRRRNRPQIDAISRLQRRTEARRASSNMRPTQYLSLEINAFLFKKSSTSAHRAHDRSTKTL
jgi:hypothetical protein